MRARAYGDSGPEVIVIHGGPGAPGSMGPVARGLEKTFRVLEPWQRRAGEKCRLEPLTVARHVEDLHQVVTDQCEGPRPALVGSSWGAMLALAYGAAHPDSTGPLVLVGCGTFDPEARARMGAVLDERLGEALRRRLRRLADHVADPDLRLRRMGELLLPAYSYDLVSHDLGLEACDARGHDESWSDMIRLQQEAVYPAAFGAIEGPVLMIHGARDPHPGELTRSTLVAHIPQLEYVEWERCGHYPWLERHRREDFFSLLIRWLGGHMARAGSSTLGGGLTG